MSAPPSGRDASRDGELRFGPDGRDWPLRAHSRFLERGGLRWHVQVLGAGPALLLLHGTGASTHSFRALLPLLARRYTVVAPDLPGHAFTSVPPGFTPSLPEMAAALGELLSALGVAPEIAVGHSAGAALIARMSLDGALTSRLLVGLCAALVPPRGAAGFFASPAARLLARAPFIPQLLAQRALEKSSVERLVRSTGSSLDARGVEFYQRLARSPAHVRGVLAMLAAWDLEPLFAELPRLATPFLLVAGEDDLAIPMRQAEEAAARLPHARLVRVPELGHLLHEEDPQLAARLIHEAAAAP